jgi:hypothetical protein
MDALSVTQICELIEKLHQAKEILQAGKLAPEESWIHEYTVDKVYANGSSYWYRYAKWQCEKPIFECNPKPNSKQNKKFTNHKHIGRVSSSSGLKMSIETIESYQVWNNTLLLQTIEKTLQDINSALEKFSNFTLKDYHQNANAHKDEFLEINAEIILNNILKVDEPEPKKEALQRIRDEYQEKDNQLRKRLPRIKKMLKLYQKSKR